MMHSTMGRLISLAAVFVGQAGFTSAAPTCKRVASQWAVVFPAECTMWYQLTGGRRGSAPESCNQVRRAVVYHCWWCSLSSRTGGEFCSILPLTLEKRTKLKKVHEQHMPYSGFGGDQQMLTDLLGTAAADKPIPPKNTGTKKEIFDPVHFIAYGGFLRFKGRAYSCILPPPQTKNTVLNHRGLNMRYKYESHSEQVGRLK